jgi:CDGSH-type Zn-finger protein
MSTEELDLNAEIEGTEDMGGFEMPPEGNIEEGTGVLMEFTGEIKPCGEDDQSLGFELAWIDNPSAKARIFCKTTTNQGLGRIVGIGNASGVFKKIDAKRTKAGKSGILSEKGTVKTKILVEPKFQEQLRQEIEGCVVLCSISHSEAKPYTDKDGVEKEGFPQANINKITSPKTVKKTATAKATSKAADTESSGSDKADNDDWDE